MDALLWIVSACLLLGGGWALWRRRRILGPVLLVAGLALGVPIGWAQIVETEGAGVSSDSVRRDASFVLRADLKPGTSRAHAARLGRSWIELAGTAGTSGDGLQVRVYGAPDATVKEMDAAMAAIRAERTVVSVVRQR
jgi:hypothetical protein